MMDGREKVNHENVTERTHEIEFRPCTCNSHPMISRWSDTIKSQVGSCNKSQVGSCNKSTASGITHKVSPCNKHYVQILPQTFPQNKVRLVTLKSKLCNTPFSSCHFVLLVYLIILLSLPAQGQDYETWEQGVPRGLRRQGFHPGGVRMDNSGFSLERGPLTLINGRLRPVSEEKKRLEGGSVKIPPSSEEPSYFPETTYPGNPRPILLKPEPEIYLTKLPPPLPASQDFNPNIQDFKEFAPSDNRRMDQGVEALVPKRSSSGDWSTRVDASTAQKEIVLDTKYFSLSYPEVNSVTSPDPGLEYVTGKPGLVLRKVKGRIKTSTLETPTSPGTETKDLCEKSILECENGSNLNGSVIPEISSVSTLNSYEELLRHFRTEVWVIPVIVAAATVILILVIFEIFLLAKAVNKNPSRRHLFLGQMLLLGLFSLAGMSVVFTLKPTTITCAVIRFGTGFSYCIVYSTLLVKLVFLVSLNSGVYLPATYQSLLLCFAILIQLVIGIQWLVSAPPSILDLEVGEGVIHQACSTLFHQQLLGLLYVVFLIVVVVLLAFKSRSVRENYREALYVGLTMGFTVSIWIVWIVAGLIVPTQYQDVCAACGMIACASITFVIMYMPKGRQLSAMGKEGLYAEDRTDVYTGSGTGSTGSSGTPSPSFFPVKPGKLAGLDERIERKERMERIERMEREDSKERQRLDTPTSSHRHLQRYMSGHHQGLYKDGMYSSLEALNSSRFPFQSQPSRSNPNVMFRKQAKDIHPGIIY